MTIESILVPVNELIPGADTFGLADLNEIAVGYKSTEVHGNPYHNEFMEPLIDMTVRKNETNELNRFRNQVIVDLGAGRRPHGYLSARLVGARGYIAIEGEPCAPKRPDMDIVDRIFTQEMVDFLRQFSQMPGSSIFYMINRAPIIARNNLQLNYDSPQKTWIENLRRE